MAWSDQEIPIGARWADAIFEQLNVCHIAVCLVSPAFLKSNFVKDEEVRRLRERHVTMVLVPLFKCDFSAVYPDLHCFPAPPERYGIIGKKDFWYGDLFPPIQSAPLRLLDHNKGNRMSYVHDLLEEVKKIPILPRRVAPPLHPTEPYVARPKEEDEIVRHFSAGSNARLVTIHGFGGLGKTQLARECVNKLAQQFPDGSRFVNLEGVKDKTPESLADAIGRQVGQQTDLGVVERLQDFLRDKKMLMVLDNYESVASPEVGAFVESLIEHTEIRLLVTGQLLVGIRSEHRVDLGGMTRDEAVKLFIERVRLKKGAQWKPEGRELSHIVAICEEANSWPLALTWAAGWTHLKTLSAIAHDLRGQLKLPPDITTCAERHSSMTKCLDWSSRLLDDSTKEIFYLLGIFPGSFTAEAASHVHGVHDIETMTTLIGLLNNAALVTDTQDTDSDQMRFTMHSFVRQYAADHLFDSSGHEGCVKRFIDYYSGILERLATKGATTESIQSEWCNIYAAMDYLVETKNWERIVSLSGPLLQFLFHRGHMQEVRRLFVQRGLDATRIAPAKGIEAKAKGKILNILGVIAQFQKQKTEAIDFFEASKKTLSDSLEKAQLSNSLGAIHLELKQKENLEKARAFHDESVQLCRELLLKKHGSPGAAAKQNRTREVQAELATALANVAMAHERLDDHKSADTALRASLDLRNEMGEDHQGLAETYNAYGRVYQNRKKWPDAAEYFRKRLESLAKVGSDKNGTARTHNSLGYVYCQWAKSSKGMKKLSLLKESETHLLQARQLCEELNDMVEKDQTLLNLQEVDKLKEQLSGRRDAPETVGDVVAVVTKPGGSNKTRLEIGVEIWEVSKVTAETGSAANLDRNDSLRRPEILPSEKLREPDLPPS